MAAELVTTEIALGRPTKYLRKYDEQVYRLCLLGAKDTEIAEFFEIAESTLNLWKLKHRTFSESIKAAKIQADATVADSLNQRALGFRWTENQPIKVKTVLYENGKRVSEVERVEIVPVERVVPPDTTAAIFWLKNRQPDTWRDKSEQKIEHEIVQPILGGAAKKLIEGVRDDISD